MLLRLTLLIQVFRHPDHIPSVNDARADLEAELQSLTDRMSAAALHKISGNALKTLYGSAGDVVLYWAHHEKLCIIDRTIAFMGGLDMCFGRWDTNSHPIADAHPGNLDAIIFPGQDVSIFQLRPQQQALLDYLSSEVFTKANVHRLNSTTMRESMTSKASTTGITTNVSSA